MKLKYYIQTGVVALAAATVGVSCTDTWDDHYSVNGTVPGATLWENMHGLGSGNYGCGSSGVD